MRKLKCCFAFIALSIILSQSCKKLEPSAPTDDRVLDGAIEGLTSAQKQTFLRGDKAFNADVFTKETGLGPLFCVHLMRQLPCRRWQGPFVYHAHQVWPGR